MAQMVWMDLKRMWRGRKLRRVILMELLLVVGYWVFSFRNIGHINADTWAKPLIQYYIVSDPFVFFGKLYSYLFPMLTAMPFATAYYDDMRSGYLGQLAIRYTTKSVLIARYIAVSLSGMLAATIGPVISLLLQAAIYPAVNPSPMSALSGISDNNFLSGLYYEHAALYILIMTLIGALIGGLMACISMVFGLFVKGQNQILFLPMLFYMFWHVLCTRYYAGYLSPLSMLDVGQGFALRGDAIAWFLIVGNIVAFSLFVIVAGRRDILKG